MGNPLKSTDIIEFEYITDYYDEYRSNGLQLARIIINGIKTRYFVRDDGEIFSENFSEKGKLKKRLPSILTGPNGESGYYLIHMSVYGVSYSKLIHRLVAQAFIPNPENKPEVNHKDGFKCHNYASNLEWVTEKENIEHSCKTGLYYVPIGEDSPKAKITAYQATKICKYLEQNVLSLQEIANTIGCSKAIVSNISQHQAWTHISKFYNIDNHNIIKTSTGSNQLHENDVKEICRLISSGKYTIREIANRFGVQYSRIMDIKRGNTWAHISREYDFSNYKKSV